VSISTPTLRLVSVTLFCSPDGSKVLIQPTILNGDGVVEFGDFIEFTGHFDAEVPPVSDLEILEGSIDQDRVLTANRTYLLRGAVFVEEGTTLIVMPGTTIQGESASTARLAISQGGLLIADGLATAPIVMTSDAPEGQRARAHQFR